MPYIALEGPKMGIIHPWVVVFKCCLGFIYIFIFLGIYRDFKIILSNFRHFLVFFYEAFLAEFFPKLPTYHLGG